MKHTITDLHQMQSLSLDAKVRMTENRIQQWIDEFGEDGVYLSFSGGKDSTVLLDIARTISPNMLAVFVDTGLEYPEIRNFVKTFDNVEWLRPKKTFKQVIEEYGYPFISKEVSDKVHGARKYLEKIRGVQADEELPYVWCIADLLGMDQRVNKDNPDYQNLKKGILPEGCDGTKNNIKRSPYSLKKYQFFLEAPFKISGQCCRIMKKVPSHSFTRRTGRKPITGQMASESLLRTRQWLINGCNGFEMKAPISNPMSFWTEQDVLLYIKENNIPICSVYGEIIEADSKEITKDARDKELFDFDRPFLKTTGCDRTGCMFCGFGCHLEKPGEGRFLRMKETHPKQYDYIMRPKEEGGLNYKEVIDWINEHGKFNIEY